MSLSKKAAVTHHFLGKRPEVLLAGQFLSVQHLTRISACRFTVLGICAVAGLAEEMTGHSTELI